MERDTAKAEHWLRKASEQGEITAMFYLSRAIMQNRENHGAPEALQWLRRSAGLGHVDAVETMKQVRSPNQAAAKRSAAVSSSDAYPSQALLLIIAAAAAADGGGAEPRVSAL